MTRTKALATVTLPVVAGLILTGCGGGSTAADDAAPDRVTPSPTASTPDATVEPAALTENEKEAADPEDGGADEPGTHADDPAAHADEPPADDPEDHQGDELPRTVVPADALLDATTVSSALGGSWTEDGAKADRCTAPQALGTVATRTTVLTGPSGRVVETVASHAGGKAAERAVDDIAGQLRACGWSASEAPPLGDASAGLVRPRGAGSALVFAAEGVTVTLVGTGKVTTARDTWETVADLALGSSCSATAHGCD